MKIFNYFIFGMFFLFFVFNVSLVSSYTSSNYNRISGSFSSVDYLSSQNINLHYSGNEEMCSSGKDFVVQVAPLGCTPTVVRSDLLEEQNVAVFCPLIATQINPLVKVDNINSISFSGNDYSEYVSGIGFHPARAALGYSGFSSVGESITNEIGYAVIVLKQEPVEANMPDYVNGSLVANIQYDMTDFGGAGVTYYIPEMDNSEWSENFNSYGFLGDEGYIKVDGVGADSATISIYSGGDYTNKVKTFTLPVGGRSNKMYFPGSFCRVATSFELEGLVDSETRAKLSISGEIIEVREGDRFLDNKCILKNIEANGLVKTIVVSCTDDSGVSNFELSYTPSVKINVEGVEYNVGIGDRILSDAKGNGLFLGKVEYLKDSSSQEDLQVSVFVSSSPLEKISDVNDKMKESSVPIKFGETVEVSEVYLAFSGFSAGKDKDFSALDSSSEFDKYFSGAMDNYDNIFNNFGNEKVDLLEGNENTYGYRALGSAIELAFETSQNEKGIELCGKFYELYPNEELAICSDKESFSNLGTSGYGLEMNGQFEEIYFLEVTEPSFSEYGVKLNVGGKSVELLKGEKKSVGTGEYVQLVSLDETSVKLNIGVKPSDSNKDFIETSVDLNKGENKNFGSNYNFGITKINLKKVAKISLVPDVETTGTTANFTFRVDIEKRAIQLSPEKTRERIDKLNETIVKWTELSENLDKVVKGFKGACIATGAVLTVKNLFGGLDGSSIARQDVNEYWKTECADLEYNGVEYVSVDDCFLKNSDSIESDIDARTLIIKDQNQKGIDNENRDSRFEEIANNLNGKTFANPDGGGETLTVGTDLKASTLSESGEGGYLLSDREMRNLEMEASILERDPGNVIAQANFDKYMGKIYTNGKAIEKANTLANKYGVDAGSVGIFGDVKKIAVKENVDRDKISKFSGWDSEDDGKYAYIGTKASGEEYVVSYNDDGIVKGVYDVNKEYKFMDSGAIETAGLSNIVFEKYDASSYENKYKNPEVTYFETEPYKGFPALVPIDSKKGWYAAMKQKTGAINGIASYEESGAVSSFSLCNVGENGLAEFNTGMGDDECRVFNPGTGNIYGTFPGLDEAETRSLVSCAMNGVEQAEAKYKNGVTSVSISMCSGGSENFKVGNPAVNLPSVQCQDFMSAKDCLILFNVCDPVICPSSRCDFGGTYPVDNVVQSGIIGSIALCLPNYKEKIFVPVCLTGIKAGIDGLVSVFENYRDCLEHNLDTGEMVGVCDQIHSIYLCEFFWKQAIPLVNMGIPKILSAFMGDGSRGGGEYSTVQAAWDNANSGVSYMTNYYGENAFAAFKAQSTESVGSSICKGFVSVSYPDSSGGFLDALLESESPAQYHAWFSETSYSTATVPATSQYKVFYHIFSGNNQGAYYNVYLSNPTGGSYYQSTGRLVIDSGYIEAGGYASETKDLTAVTGYNELCISVNGEEECGFEQVSTSFAVDYMSDKFIEDQVTEENINSEADCVSGTSSAYSLLNLNIEAGASDFIDPELYNKGIIRVCSTSNPGKETDTNWNVANSSRWKKVGVCDSESIGCWIDTDSVENVIKSTSIEESALGDITDKYMEALGEENYLDMDEEEFNSFINNLGDDEKGIISKIDSDVLSTILMNSNKAKLLLIRANAYDGLAIKAWLKLVAEQIALSEKEAAALTSVSLDKSCEGLGGMIYDIDGFICSSIDMDDISNSVSGLGNEEVCCRDKSSLIEGWSPVLPSSLGFDDKEYEKAFNKIESLLGDENNEVEIANVLRSLGIKVWSSIQTVEFESDDFCDHGDSDNEGTCLSGLKAETVFVLLSIQEATSEDVILTGAAEKTGHASSGDHPKGLAIDIDDTSIVDEFERDYSRSKSRFKDKYGFSKDFIDVIYGVTGHYNHMHISVLDEIESDVFIFGESIEGVIPVFNEEDIPFDIMKCLDPTIDYNYLGPTGAATSDSCSLKKGPFYPDIYNMTKSMNVDFNLITSVIEVESNWKPSDISPGKAMGLMQITAITFADVNQKGEKYCGKLSDYVPGKDFSSHTDTKNIPNEVLANLLGGGNTKINLYYGICYLKIIDEAPGYGNPPDLEYLLTAYNMGPFGLKSACPIFEKDKFVDTCRSNLPNDENKEYAGKVLAKYNLVNK